MTLLVASKSSGYCAYQMLGAVMCASAHLSTGEARRCMAVGGQLFCVLLRQERMPVRIPVAAG